MQTFYSDALVGDYLLLETVGGAVPFLLRTRPPESECRMKLVAKGDDWASFHYEGPVESLVGIRLFSTCNVVLAALRPDSLPDRDEIDERITESVARGLLRLLGEAQGASPINFRVGPLRFGRWDLRDHLVNKHGWLNDPSDWQVNVAAIGPYLVAQVGPLYFTKRFGQLRRSPTSTNPVVAALMVHLLEPQSGEAVYDAFCGTGTNLVEVLAKRSTVHVMGSDFRSGIVLDAARNLHERGQHSLFVADAAAIPLNDKSIQCAISNLPFGKRTGSHARNKSLYPRYLNELGRILNHKGRAVLLSEDKRLMRSAIQSVRQILLVDEYSIFTGGLHPSVFVLRTR
jgi:tRNA (guanine6-N2)-methyltransferase